MRSWHAYLAHNEAKGHDLEDALQGEEHCEGCVQMLQDRVIGSGGRVVLHRGQENHTSHRQVKRVPH